MYFTRRTTPWPRLKVSIDPSVETHYNRKFMKDYFIKQAHFEKAKQEKKLRALQNKRNRTFTTSPINI
ncbi:uncharacterized protein LOC124362958 isoform X2 [Homalodisca vitripennis]|nr:uncharacterized protein LOC124362958 isoform X2 [Homalodisca vitripennis]